MGKRRQKRTKNHVSGGISCAADTQNVHFWIEDHQHLPQTNTSSDTDDNSPPKEPTKIRPSCRRIRSSPGRISRKIFPTTIPSPNVGLNHVPAMPTHLRRPPVRRPRILDPMYCKKPRGKLISPLIEKLPDSSSEDESDYIRSARYVLTSTYKASSFHRPRSAPGSGGTTPAHRKSEPRYPEADDAVDASLALSGSAVETLESTRPLLEAILATDESLEAIPSTPVKVGERRSRIFSKSHRTSTSKLHIYRTSSRTTLQSSSTSQTSVLSLKSEIRLGRSSIGKPVQISDHVSKSDTKVVSAGQSPECLSSEDDASVKQSSKLSLECAEKKVSISSSDSMIQRAKNSLVCPEINLNNGVSTPIPLQRKLGKVSHRVDDD